MRQNAEELARKLQLNYLLRHSVDEVDLSAKTLKTGEMRYSAKTIVLATGYRRRRLPLSLKPAFHHGIFYEKHGAKDELRGQVVAIMGGGDNAPPTAPPMSASGTYAI